jgi:hypothetical protein
MPGTEELISHIFQYDSMALGNTARQRLTDFTLHSRLTGSGALGYSLPMFPSNFLKVAASSGSTVNVRRPLDLTKGAM